MSLSDVSAERRAALRSSLTIDTRQVNDGHLHCGEKEGHVQSASKAWHPRRLQLDWTE
jgi:hypothetical protein